MITTRAVRKGRGAPATALDDRLPVGHDSLRAGRKLFGSRTRAMVWGIVLVAIAVRVVLLPLDHWWDITTFYNTFIDLGHNHSPYATFATLSHIAQASGWGDAYEYFAYPPATIYLYYPLARLFLLLHPSATYFIPVSGAPTMPSLPLDFYVLFKLPMWVADFAIGALLARLSGTVRGFRDYLLNPYVLLVSAAWTFDALMVLAVLCGVYWLYQGKLTRAGAALAVGTALKFIPIVLVPTCLIYLFKKQRSFKEMGGFLAAYIVVTAVLVAPFLSGVLSTFAFQTSRIGGGMNLEQVWVVWQFFPSLPSLPVVQQAIGSFGTPMLLIALLIAYWRVFTGTLSLNRMIIVTLVAFFLGSKIVNEQYALVVFPFLFIEARRQGGVWRWFFHLFWIVPLLFAVMRVPIDRFLWPLYHTLFPASANMISVTNDTGFEMPFVPWKHAVVDPVGMVALGVAFFVLCIVVFVWPSDGLGHARVYLALATGKLRSLPAAPALALSGPTPSSGSLHADVAHGARLDREDLSEVEPIVQAGERSEGRGGGSTTGHGDGDEDEDEDEDGDEDEDSRQASATRASTSSGVGIADEGSHAGGLSREASQTMTRSKRMRTRSQGRTKWSRADQLARHFIQRASVPLVLLVGVLVLVTVHFTSEMHQAQAQQNATQGLLSCAMGKMQTTFRRDDGSGRPAITYGGAPVLSFADWSSVVTIDGVTQELWNNYHGYSIENGGCTVYSTTTGDNWQVVEIASLVNDHTVQVSYEFVALANQGTQPPQAIDLEIIHTNPIWYQPAVSGDTLTAQVLPKGAKASQPALPIGTLTLSVSGAQVSPQAPLALGEYHAAVGPNGTGHAWASSVTTHYTLTSPTLSRLTPLGTEVITFTPADQTNGTPASAPVAPPTPSL